MWWYQLNNNMLSFGPVRKIKTLKSILPWTVFAR